MATVKISELPAVLGPLEDDDILLLVRDGVTAQIDGEVFNTLIGVEEFNGRTGDVTLQSSDVTTALGYTPVQRNATTLTLYGNNSSGTPVSVPYSQGGIMGSTIGQRTVGGQLLSETLEDDHAQAEEKDLVNRVYASRFMTRNVEAVIIAAGVLDLSQVASPNVIVDVDQDITSILLPAGEAGFKKELNIRFEQDDTGGWVVDLSDFNWTIVTPTVDTTVNSVTYIKAVNFSNLGWDGI